MHSWHGQTQRSALANAVESRFYGILVGTGRCARPAPMTATVRSNVAIDACHRKGPQRQFELAIRHGKRLSTLGKKGWIVAGRVVGCFVERAYGCTAQAGDGDRHYPLVLAEAGDDHADTVALPYGQRLGREFVGERYRCDLPAGELGQRGEDVGRASC